MTEEHALRRLTDDGIERFRTYLTNIRYGSVAVPPFDLLTDPAASGKIDEDIRIENCPFATRLELARYLDEILVDIEAGSIETDVHLWGWLSLFYFDQVCPAGKGGVRKPGRDYRHLLEPGYRYGHNHLLAGAYLVYTLHSLGDELARLLLCTPLHIESGFHHQLAQRQSIITNKGLMEAADRLYFDDRRNKPKAGALARDKGGTLFRFIDVVQQFDLNYDLYSMTGAEVLQLLPPEFDRWK